jgi:hypothetical protein
MALVVGNFSIAPWRRIRPFERAGGGSRGCCSLCRSPRHPRRHGRSDADHLPHRAKGEGYRMGPLLDSVQLPTKSGWILRFMVDNIYSSWMSVGFIEQQKSLGGTILSGFNNQRPCLWDFMRTYLHLLSLGESPYWGGWLNLHGCSICLIELGLEVPWGIHSSIGFSPVCEGVCSFLVQL